MTVQIYNTKMRLSRVLVKKFTTIFSSKIKQFNNHYVSINRKNEKIMLYLRG